MKTTFKRQSGKEATLVRGRKYTKLYLGNSTQPFYTWLNETIERILGDFDKQVEHFKNNI